MLNISYISKKLGGGIDEEIKEQHGLLAPDNHLQLIVDQNILKGMKYYVFQ